MIEKILEKLRRLYDFADCYEDDYHVGKYSAYKDAIEIVQEVANEHRKLNRCDTCTYYEKGFEDGAESVRALAPYEDSWIPCSERLPEFDQEVLITADDCTVYQCVMRNGGLCVFEDGWIDIKHVIAWQPLPAPYQKGE